VQIIQIKMESVRRSQSSARRTQEAARRSARLQHQEILRLRAKLATQDILLARGYKVMEDSKLELRKWYDDHPSVHEVAERYLNSRPQ